jgi:NitT/TauT family transport system substrate-binding protein
MNGLRDNRVYCLNRRTFLAKTTALGTGLLLGLPRMALAEPPPETTKIRLTRGSPICFAPQFLAEELLRLEGFSEVEYVNEEDLSTLAYVAADRADMAMYDAPGALPQLDADKPAVLIAGIHGGCYELFGRGAIRSVRDLKGKTVAVYGLEQGGHVLVASMLAYVGLDPNKDVNWLAGERAEDAVRFFSEGRADAFMGFPPHPQELRAKKIGHVVLDTSQDKPWSQLFCCMLATNRGFFERNPVATRRALRAFLKAADICAQDPTRAARYMVDNGYERSYETAHEVLNQVSYSSWRELNPEDTLRFHALRLHEAGMIKTSPNKLIAKSTDWRFLNELKKELKA